MSALPPDETMIDQLCEHATRGLDDPSALHAVDASLLEQFELAAAALSVAMVHEDEPMPASLRSKLSIAAREHNQNQQSPHQQSQDSQPKLKLAGTPSEAPAKSSLGGIASLGWLAAAACLTLAVVAWSSRPGGSPDALPLAEQYAALAATPGIKQASWAGLDDLALTEAPHKFDQELTGEVIWDDATQTGFMKFTGLAANDPEELQYQLWIFDANRPAGDLPDFAIEGFPELLTQRPVDGGVFDIAPDGTAIIPIDAKLFVGNAAIFAITVEPPGGVVVSDRDIVTAAIPG